MNVIVLQPDIVWEDKLANFDRARRLLERAGPEDGSVVVLPEMFATGFSMNVGRCAESYGAETEQFLASLAREFRVCVVAGAAIRGRDGRARNKALVFSADGALLAFYAKRRLFTPGGEDSHFVPGEQASVFEWGGCKFAPFICYDLRFPELFRQATLGSGPEVLVVIANWPAKRVQHWLRLLPARAVENQAYVVAANRVGKDPYYQYCGRSLILDPHGDIIADAGESEGYARAQLELSRLAKYREGLPFLKDGLAGLVSP